MNRKHASLLISEIIN